MIADFDIPVADILSHNAGTPRLLLGIAATLARMPDVLGYSVSGLDPSGEIAVHNFALSKSNNYCLVHLSLPRFFGDGSPAPRSCPAKAQCVPLTEDSSRNDRIV
jgi:hypothetical protein